MVKSQALPHAFWLEAIMCATHVLSRCPTKALQSVTPYEAWHGRKPSIAHLRVFGCLAYALVPQQHQTKLDDKAVNASLLGIAMKVRAIICFIRKQRRSWSVEMLCLWKMLFSHCCHVPERHMYAHKT